MPQEAIAPATSAPAIDQTAAPAAGVQSQAPEQVAAPASTGADQTQATESASQQEEQFQLEGIDPKNLPPELQQVYKNMEAGWTKLSQKKSEKIREEMSKPEKLAELLGGNPDLVSKLVGDRFEDIINNEAFLQKAQEYQARNSQQVDLKNVDVTSMNVNQALQNWSRLSPQQQQDFYQAQDEDGKERLWTKLQLVEAQRDRVMRWVETEHNQLAAKYDKDSVNKLKPKLDQLQAHFGFQLPREMAFKFLDYENAVKRAHEAASALRQQEINQRKAATAVGQTPAASAIPEMQFRGPDALEQSLAAAVQQFREKVS